MKTTTQVNVHSAMARLADARPAVANHTEGIVPRAERAQLLRSIMETPVLPTATVSHEPTLEPDRSWMDVTTPPAQRRRVLAGALVAAVVAAGLGVAGLVGTSDEDAQVSAGPGEGPSLPALAPETPATSFAPTGLPDTLLLQEVSVEPAVPPLPGSPYAEVYGRAGQGGTIDEAVAVITATAPDFVDALVRDSGGTTAPVPGRAGQLDIDFGRGLVGRSFDTDEPETVCGTGGCVVIVDQDNLHVMVLGRDLEGALPGIVEELELRADATALGERVEAPALVADGYAPVYEGDQVPGLSPGPQTVLRYGDETGGLGMTLRLEEGRDFDPASIAWQFPETRTVKVRGHDGLLVADDRLTSVTWQERPGLTLSLDVTGFSEDEAVDIANGLEEVTEAPWLPVRGTVGDGDGPQRRLGGDRPDSVVSNGPGRSGPEVVLGEGQAGGQRWQLVGYEIEPASGSGDADVCIELRADTVVSGGCSRAVPFDPQAGPEKSFLSLGVGAEVGGHLMFRGEVHPDVATVHFQLENGDTLDVATLAHDRFGTHVVAAMPLDAPGATVVLLDEAGAELERIQYPASGPPVGN